MSQRQKRRNHNPHLVTMGQKLTNSVPISMHSGQTLSPVEKRVEDTHTMTDIPPMTTPTSQSTSQNLPLPGLPIPGLKSDTAISEKLEEAAKKQVAKGTKVKVAEEPMAPGQLTRAQQKLADAYAGLFTMIGSLVASKDMYDGLVLAVNAQARADEFIAALRHSKTAYKYAEKAINGGDIGKCVIGWGMMTYAILAHHDRIPKNDALLAVFGYDETSILKLPSELDHANAGNGH